MDDMTVARQALAMLKQNMAAAECHMAAINHYRTMALDAISLLEKMCAAPQPLTADEVKLKETVEPVLTAPVDEIVDQQPAEEAVDANPASSEVITADQSTETDAHELAQAADVVEEPPAPVEEKPKPRSKKKTKAKAEPEPEQPQPEPAPEPDQPQSEQPAPEPDPEPAPEPVQPADQPAADGPQVSRVVDMQTRVIELHYTQPEIEVMEQTFTNLVEFVKAHPGANEQSADPAAFEEFRATVTALPSEDELCAGVTEQLRATLVNDLRYDVLLFLPSQRALTVAEWARTQRVEINGYAEFMATLQDQLTAAKTAPEPEQKPEPAPVETVEVQPEDIEPAPADTPTAPLLTAEGTPPVSAMPQETSWADVEQEIAADHKLAAETVLDAVANGQPDPADFAKTEGITVVDPQAERKAAQEKTKPEPTPAPEQTSDPTAKPMPWPEEDDPFANYTPDGKPTDDQPFDPKNYEKINQVPAKFMDVFLLKAQSIYDKLAKDFPDDDQELDRRTVAYENALEVARLMDGGNDELTAVQKVGPRIGRQVMLLKGNRS